MGNPLAEHWWDTGLCRNVPQAQHLFFSEEIAGISSAKRICADCPVIAPCLEGAIRRGDRLIPGRFPNPEAFGWE